MSPSSPDDLPQAEIVDGGDDRVADDPPEPRRHGGLWNFAALVVQLLAVAVALGGGTAAAVYLLRTGPTASRRQPERRAALVTVREVRLSNRRATIEAMGAVRAAQTITLLPRVSGEIVEISPECIPGGRFAKGAVIARIDPADYQIAVEERQGEVARLTAALEQQRSLVAQRESDIANCASLIEQREGEILQRESNVIQAAAALKIERGQQEVARREYELLGKELSEADRDLVLRVPQLQQAEAACEAAKAAKRAALAAKKAAEASKAAAEAMKRSAEAGVKAAEAAKAAAEAALKQAKLDLARTTIRAPFNAVVSSEFVDLGSQVSPTSKLATLVGTDEYWVEVSVPVDRLKWLRIPRAQGEEGSPVRIYDEAAWGQGVFREGRVVRMASALESEGRMARLLVSVPDPFGGRGPSGRTPPLLIDSYVRVEMDGSELEGVVALERALVRDGDRAWVMNDAGELEIRPIETIFRNREYVMVSAGLKPGDLLVTSDLPAPVAGMPLRTPDDAPSAPPGREAGRQGAAPHGGSNVEAHGQ